VSVVA